MSYFSRPGTVEPLVLYLSVLGVVVSFGTMVLIKYLRFRMQSWVLTYYVLSNSSAEEAVTLNHASANLASCFSHLSCLSGTPIR